LLPEPCANLRRIDALAQHRNNSLVHTGSLADAYDGLGEPSSSDRDRAIHWSLRSGCSVPAAAHPDPCRLSRNAGCRWEAPRSTVSDTDAAVAFFNVSVNCFFILLTIAGLPCRGLTI
jgi:hypothetical protein